MSYELIFSDSALKQLKKLEKKNQERVVSSLERIRIRPERFVTKLVGDPGFRLRVGDFRVILDILPEQSLIIVLKIGHRKRIYQ
jgi:mRNA interferase RelE/StbE